jgi:hypothetical protein
MIQCRKSRLNPAVAAAKTLVNEEVEGTHYFPDAQIRKKVSKLTIGA